MPTPDSPSRATARQLAALLLGPLLVYAVLITFSFLQRPQDYAVKPVAWFVLALAAAYLLVFAGWQYLVLRLVCRETPGALNLRQAGLSSDLQTGALVFVLIAIANVLVVKLFDEPNATLAQSTGYMAEGGWLLLASLAGTWLTAATEEITRALLLSRLLRLSATWLTKVLALVLAAGLFSLVHAYQGTYGLVNAGLLGLILAGAYIYNGRLRPLVLAHGLFNSFLILYWVVTVHWNLWEF